MSVGGEMGVLFSIPLLKWKISWSLACVLLFLFFKKPYVVNLYRYINEDQKGRKENINIVVLHELLSQSKIGATYYSCGYFF